MLELYTACRDCGDILRVTNADTVHGQGCEPRPTTVERLGQEWLAAVLAGDACTADLRDEDIEAIDRRGPRLREAALAYAAMGWPVFPLRPLSKTPATRHGFKDATTDAERINVWWVAHPTANIGLATGHRFDVVDVDVPHGVSAHSELIESGDLPAAHGQVATSSGGVHYYVAPTGHGNRAGIRVGIDYRGLGGYVVAPPSTLGPRGRAWGWVSAPSPTIKTMAA